MKTSYDLDRVRAFLAQLDPKMGQWSDDRLRSLLSRSEAKADPSEHGRWQDAVIQKIIPHGSSVLDLGCGEGELLSRLIATRQVYGQGIELNPDAVLRCVVRGVPVLQTNLDAGLRGFQDRGFDYVILEETLQTLYRPIGVMSEMLRVGRRGIVSFPNFGYWQVRLDLALRGRMPKTDRLPFHWYDTPNIHLFTLRDFVEWTVDAGVTIVQGYVLADDGVRPMQEGDNLYAREVLIVVEQVGRHEAAVNEPAGFESLSAGINSGD